MDMPKIIMIVGLPGSGKSYHAQQLAERYNANVHSNDAIREELSGDINNQDINTLVFQTLHNRIKEDLKSGKSCIYDATNINYKRRKAFLQELKNIPCEKICTFMAVPYEKCLKRNTERERKVPEEVIKRMYMNINIPYWYEGWDDIVIVYNYDEYFLIYKSTQSLLKKLSKYDQGNSHHTLTLGEHMDKAFEYCHNNNYSQIVQVVAGLHDIGKPFCRTNLNTKGVDDGETHYYHHQFTGAYDSLFYKDIEEPPLEVAIRIMWHMQPYFNHEQKTIDKYRRLWGEELYNDIMCIHEADKAAH